MINPFVKPDGEAVELATTSASLLALARAQDAQAWERLVEEYGPALYSWCRHDGLNPEDAADVTQEVLLTVFLKLDEFRKQEEADTFRGWLRRVARNRVRDFWKLACRRPAPAAGGTSFGERVSRRVADATTESLDLTVLALLEATERVRERCDERTWGIFSHYVRDGFTAEETAAEFQVTIGYVHLVRARLLGRFRKELQKLRNPSSSKHP